jgi:hypothetical protein
LQTSQPFPVSQAAKKSLATAVIDAMNNFSVRLIGGSLFLALRRDSGHDAACCPGWRAAHSS